MRHEWVLAGQEVDKTLDLDYIRVAGLHHGSRATSGLQGYIRVAGLHQGSRATSGLQGYIRVAGLHQGCRATSE